jgi:flagellar biosynthesis anti-sigma factor FlgM
MRISAINELYNPELRKADAAKKVEAAKSKTVSPDRTEFSSDAQRLSETKAQVGIVAAQIANQPDIRQDKVAEAKQKIQDGYYNTPEFVDKLAGKMAQDFGVK